MSLARPTTAVFPTRFTAWTIASVYILVLLGTFLHLGVHDHIYSPRLNAFVHPMAGSSGDAPLNPVSDSRTTTDPRDHSLQFTIGDEAPAVFDVAVVALVRRVVPQPWVHEPEQRSIYHVAPKQSPPVS